MYYFMLSWLSTFLSGMNYRGGRFGLVCGGFVYFSVHKGKEGRTNNQSSAYDKRILSGAIQDSSLRGGKMLPASFPGPSTDYQRSVLTPRKGLGLCVCRMLLSFYQLPCMRL